MSKKLSLPRRMGVFSALYLTVGGMFLLADLWWLAVISLRGLCT